MVNNSKLKLFISYSHKDEDYVNEFIEHLAPLKDNGFIKEWYDRKILAGDTFQDTIENNLENADIICLCVSASFLNSNACMKEKRKAFNLKNTRNVCVIPIILSPCGWLDDKEISEKLAIPKDGKPVTGFVERNFAWNNIYSELKKISVFENKIRTISITKKFRDFLQNTELLSKAHSQKELVTLDDIFVFPILWKFNDLIEYEDKIHSEKIIDQLFKEKKMLIAGEDQSGKTTLSKKLFSILFEHNFIPVYIEEKSSAHQENIKSKITKALKEQYNFEIQINKYDLNNRIIPIIDNFHLVKKREKYIDELSVFKFQILFVDNIFTLNFKNEEITQSFSHYQIRELNPLQRNELIEKWISLTERENHFTNSENQRYKTIDKATEFVNTTLGKILSSGIMPAYPFFILSIISTYETFEKPLDQEITSQGYCYQALIYLYLRKQGVKNDDFDIYMNFLTEVSFYIFSNHNHEIPIDDFNEFMEGYEQKFNFPIEREKLITNLRQAQIFIVNSFNNFSFQYPYLYYYFVAKYLAEHQDSKKDIINNIFNNLHKNEYAYIAIFISHHSKNVDILDEIILNSMVLFDQYVPATLDKDELSFFDNQINSLIKEILPSANEKPGIERKKRLEAQEIIEESNNNIEEDEEIIENNDFAKEIRRSVKTVEVMGRIIRNRAGSIEKEKLLTVFIEATNVHLRFLSSFFNLIKDEKQQSSIVNFISSRLDFVSEEKGRDLSEKELEKISKIIFWNINFDIVYVFVSKVIKSLGSDRLVKITNEACDYINTPASFLIKHGILMWYNKNLQIDEIAKQLKNDKFSEISKKIMKAIIVDHASMHSLDYKDRQRVEAKIGIKSKRLLIESTKIED